MIRYLCRNWVVESPVVALLSRHAAISSSCLASRRPLVAPPSYRLIAQVGCCCVASQRAAVLSSHRLLTAPLSCHLIAPSGVASPLVALSFCPLLALSLRRPLVV